MHTRTWPRASALLVVAGAVLAAGGCVANRRDLRLDGDTSAPQPKEFVLNILPALEPRVTSRSTAVPPLDKAAVRRLVVGPNVFFEASRSSLKDAATSGPEGADATEIGTGDALGRPVDTALSSLLVEHLARSKVAPVVPAIFRKWFGEVECERKDKEGAPAGPCLSWMERLLLASGRAGKGEDLPGAALAVRELRWQKIEVELAVRGVEGGEYEAVPWAGGKVPVCGPFKVELPQLVFRAEVVALRDGRLLARVDETRTPAVKGPLKRAMPVEWRSALDCDAAVREVKDAVEQLKRATRERPAVTAQDAFHSGLTVLAP